MPQPWTLVCVWSFLLVTCALLTECSRVALSQMVYHLRDHEDNDTKPWKNARKRQYYLKRLRKAGVKIEVCIVLGLFSADQPRDGPTGVVNVSIFVKVVALRLINVFTKRFVLGHRLTSTAIRLSLSRLTFPSNCCVRPLKTSRCVMWGEATTTTWHCYRTVLFMIRM